MFSDAIVPAIVLERANSRSDWLKKSRFDWNCDFDWISNFDVTKFLKNFGELISYLFRLI